MIKSTKTLKSQFLFFGERGLLLNLLERDLLAEDIGEDLAGNLSKDLAGNLSKDLSESLVKAGVECCSASRVTQVGLSPSVALS